MIKEKLPLADLTKRAFILGCLFVVLVVAVFLYISNKASPVAQAQGLNINILQIGNNAPSVGGWQEVNYNSPNSYELWKYRNDGFYRDTEPCSTGTCSRNKTPLEDNLIDFEARYGISKDEILNTTPFLVVGYSSNTGFRDTELELDLWIPYDLAIDSVELVPNDLCFSIWDSGNNGGRGNAITDVYIRGKKDELKIIDGSSSTCSQQNIRASTASIGEPIDDKILNIGGVNTRYKKYIVRAATNYRNFYSNQFRLEATSLDSNFKDEDLYLSIPATGSGVNNVNTLNVSSRLPSHKTVGGPEFLRRDDYISLQVLWDAEIYIAPDGEKGCSSIERKAIGIYDSDYDTGAAQRWAYANTAFPPTLTIYQDDRNNSDGNWEIAQIPLAPGSLAGSQDATFIFDGFDENGNPVSQNKWEDHYFDFRGDKIYRLHFYNIDQRTWIQFRIPFDQINSLQKCIDAPLVKVNYSDVSAGGRFGMGGGINACMNQTNDLQESSIDGNIYTHFDKENASSAQYAVYANDEIIGFYSNFTGTLPISNNSATNLTFANHPSSDWGGQLKGNGRCIPNYWRGVPSSVDNATNVAIDAAAEDKLYKPSSGSSLTLTPQNTSANLKKTLYVEGDLIIKNNIINNGGTSTTPWTSFNQIGYIYLIVKGDILIDPKVTQIDAILVAMPNDSDKKGRIYTCSPNSVVSGSTTLNSQINNDADSKAYANDCVNKLTVNGALIAQEVHLGRVVDLINPSNSGRVKEEINLLPEYFVGTPLLPALNEWKYNSDSLVVLPINF